VRRVRKVRRAHKVSPASPERRRNGHKPTNR
jgi:hypothetical protein